MNFAMIKSVATVLFSAGGISGFIKIIENAENEVKNLSNLQAAGALAPERLDTSPPGKGVNAMVRDMPFQKKLSLLPVIVRVINSVATCGTYMKDKLKPQRHAADEATWDDIRSLAIQQGATEIGFTEIDDNDIFENFAIPYKNAIVFTIEMDKTAIDTAPGFDALIEVLSTYASLGDMALMLTDKLRDAGYGAYPGFPVRGLVDYVRVAQAAGLGSVGYHGLLISPTSGTRQRINVVFTNMDIPESAKSDDNPHEWILDFCAKCVKCVRSCPPEAIFTDALIQPETGRKQTIHYDKCLDYYAANQGCAICVKVCPFSQAGYDKIQDGFLTAMARQQ